MLPQRIKSKSGRENASKRFPGHRAWVRGHACSVPGCGGLPIECAHVRSGTGGGLGVKPADWWTISLCRDHHTEQHRIGEAAFERRHGIDMKNLALAFAKASPHWPKMREFVDADD